MVHIFSSHQKKGIQYTQNSPRTLRLYPIPISSASWNASRLSNHHNTGKERNTASAYFDGESTFAIRQRVLLYDEGQPTSVTSHFPIASLHLRLQYFSFNSPWCPLKFSAFTARFSSVLWIMIEIEA